MKAYRLFLAPGGARGICEKPFAQLADLQDLPQYGGSWKAGSSEPRFMGNNVFEQALDYLEKERGESVISVTFIESGDNNEELYTIITRETQ